MLKTDQATLLEALRTALPNILAPYPVALAYLFGSSAVGQATPLSDVDIALLLNKDAAPPNRLNTELEIEDTLARSGLSAADVRIINDAPLELRGEVVTQGCLLYARDDDARIEFETRTRMEYFDFQPTAEYHRQQFFHTLRERGLRG